jgi:hypothetical protein
MLRDLSSRRALLSALLTMLPVAAAAQNSLLDEGRGLLKQLPSAKTPSPSASGGQGAGASLSQGEIGSGLKDALKVASQRVVGRVGKTNGYNGDPSIRIPLPGPVQSIQGSARAACSTISRPG